MATRKKGKKKTRRRRRVGGMSLTASNPVVLYGSIAVGALTPVGKKVNEVVDRFTGTMDGKIKGAATGGVGLALVKMKLGKKKTIFEVVGGGVLIGAGVKRLLTEFGIMNGIGGYGAVPVIGAGRRNMGGYGAVPVIGQGYTIPQSMNGAFNGAFNGYTVPRSMNNIMGSASGSGLMSNSGFMD